MRRATVLIVGLLAMAASGCTIAVGQLRLGMMYGVNVTIIHTCTREAKVFHGDDPMAHLVGPAPAEIGFMPKYGGRSVAAAVHSLDSTGKVVAIHTQRLEISDYDREPQWYIGDDWNAGAGARYQSRCSR